ncbi:MAG: hypothetical protein LUH15_02445, partial [Tannerellaceae bacterium]|nr:hypothetical protein [Tannerellaceae bacterium]
NKFPDLPPGCKNLRPGDKKLQPGGKILSPGRKFENLLGTIGKVRIRNPDSRVIKATNIDVSRRVIGITNVCC